MVHYVRDKDNTQADLLSRLHSGSPVDPVLLKHLTDSCTWDKVYPKCITLNLTYDFRCHRYLKTPTSSCFGDVGPGLQTVNHSITLTSFQNFLRFPYFHGLSCVFTVHNILTFIIFIYTNSLPPKVIRNYLSSISSMAQQFNLDPSIVHHQIVQTLYYISVSCDILSDPSISGPYSSLHILASYLVQYCSSFLVNFFPDKRLLRRDLMLSPPGAHLLIKWMKTLQDHKSHHVVPLPQLANVYFCPVRVLKTLLSSRSFY